MSSLDMVCELHKDSVPGLLEALTSIRWKRSNNQDDAVLQLMEGGMILIVQDLGCRLQGKVYLSHELFVNYRYVPGERSRIGLSFGLFVDCLKSFNEHSSTLELCYPGPDMQLILRSSTTSTDSVSSGNCYAEIGTWNPEPFADLHEPDTSTSLRSTMIVVKSSVLKEAIDDLKWFGSSIQMTVQPATQSFTFKGEGQVDLQIDFVYDVNNDLVTVFSCRQVVSHRYNYKFLHATTSNMPSSVMNDTHGTRLTIMPGGLLKVQYCVKMPNSHHSPAYIEFLLKPLAD